ncbi:MAG: FtsX-like permease family protein [Clostridia bacterium]
MKLTIYYKDSIRKLKTSIFRYISIIVIIMLGVGFFVGMNSVAPDMKKTTEEYLKTSNVFDIQLASNLGYDKKDIEKFEQIEEITEVEPVYNYDVLTTINDKNLPVRIISKTKDQKINKNDIIEGKDVQFPNECLIDTRLHSIYNLNVGDKIKIHKNEEDLSKVISKTEYTIVGITRNPAYLSIFYGSTELENGELVGYVNVLEDNIKLEKYTSMYLKTNIDNNINKTSEEYKNKLDDIAKKVEDTQNSLLDEKYKEVYEKYTKEIEKSQNELTTKQNEINTAKQTIENSQKQINSSILQVSSLVANYYQSSQIYERFQTKKTKLDELYLSYSTLNSEKNTIETEYEKLKEEVENKQNELSKLNNNINNKLYEIHLLGNNNPKYIEQTRKANELDYTYNLQKKEFSAVEEKYKKLEKDLEEKQKNIKTLKEQLDKEQENFYNNFLSTEDIMLGTGNQELIANVQEIKKSQEALNTSKTEFEKENYDKKIEEAKTKLSNSKNDLKNFEKLSQVTKLYESSGFKSLDNDLEKIAIMGKVFPVMFFIVAALVTITTITRMIEEDRTNIGILKALGYSKTTIMKRYIIYSLSATIIGVIIGTLLGSTLIAQVLFAAYGSLYDLPSLIIEINVLYTALATIISVIATVGVTFIITKKELKQKTADLLRPKPAKEGKNIFLEKIPSFWSKLSFLFKICFRNIFRYKRRLFMTLIGIAGCTMLVYTGIALNDTINNIAERQFGDVRAYKMEINLTSGVTQNEVYDIQKYIEQQDKITRSNTCKTANDNNRSK